MQSVIYRKFISVYLLNSKPHDTAENKDLLDQIQIDETLVCGIIDRPTITNDEENYQHLLPLMGDLRKLIYKTCKTLERHVAYAANLHEDENSSLIEMYEDDDNDVTAKEIRVLKKLFPRNYDEQHKYEQTSESDYFGDESKHNKENDDEMGYSQILCIFLLNKFVKRFNI